MVATFHFKDAVVQFYYFTDCARNRTYYAIVRKKMKNILFVGLPSVIMIFALVAISYAPQSQETSVAIFTVQVGIFGKFSYAEALRERLYERGYNSYITISISRNNEKLFRVCIGRFNEREKAESLSVKIKKTENLEAFVTLY